MAQAMNTGHDGSLSTGHANSAADMISRLETMTLSAVDLPVAVVRSQIASAIDILVHLARLRDGSRRIVEIQEIVGLTDGVVRMNPLFRFEEHTGGTASTVTGRLTRTEHRLAHSAKLRAAGRSTGRW